MQTSLCWITVTYKQCPLFKRDKGASTFPLEHSLVSPPIIHSTPAMEINQNHLLKLKEASLKGKHKLTLFLLTVLGPPDPSWHLPLALSAFSVSISSPVSWSTAKPSPLRPIPQPSSQALTFLPLFLCPFASTPSVSLILRPDHKQTLSVWLSLSWSPRFPHIPTLWHTGAANSAPTILCYTRKQSTRNLLSFAVVFAFTLSTDFYELPQELYCLVLYLQHLA